MVYILSNKYPLDCQEKNDIFYKYFIYKRRIKVEIVEKIRLRKE